MADTIPVRVQHKRMTAAQWRASSVILLAGELGVESDTGFVKVGDGSSRFTNLKYLTGPKGDKGEQGLPGPKGADGVVTFESLTPQQKASLKGEKGDKGEPLRFTDLTQAQKNELKGEKGDPGNPYENIEIGGRNLFLKPDFGKEGDGKIWTTSTYTASIDSSSKYLGQDALKIVGLEPQGRDGNNPKVTYPAIGMYGRVLLGSMTAKDVVISFYAKSGKEGTILQSRLGNYGVYHDVVLSTEIKRYVVKIPKSALATNKNVSNDWVFKFNRADTVYIWMAKFEVGTVPTDWSPALEELQSASSERGPQGLPGRDGAKGEKGDPGQNILNSRTNQALKYWAGSKADYDRISAKDANTIYDVWE